MNILTYLDTNLGFDDEKGIVYKNTAKELADVLARDVNSYSFSPEKLYRDYEKELAERYPDKDVEITSRYAKQRLHTIAVCWFSFYGHFPKKTPDLDGYGIHVDDRNRAAKALAEAVIQRESFKEMENLYDTDFSEYHTNEKVYYEWSEPKRFFFEFLKAVNAGMHKTLQQTATKLMYFALFGQKINLPLV